MVLADQVKSQDWRARQATRKGRVTAAELAEIRAKSPIAIGGRPRTEAKWREAAHEDEQLDD